MMSRIVIDRYAATFQTDPLPACTGAWSLRASMLLFLYLPCPGGGMADAEDLKSSGDFSSCGFDSHPGHHVLKYLRRIGISGGCSIRDQITLTLPWGWLAGQFSVIPLHIEVKNIVRPTATFPNRAAGPLRKTSAKCRACAPRQRNNFQIYGDSHATDGNRDA
jgi:hypothetical protein